MTQKLEMITETNLGQMKNAVQRVAARTDQTANYLSTETRLNDLLREYDLQIPSGTEFDFSVKRPSFVKEYDYLKLAVEVQGILSSYADNWLDGGCQIGLVMNDGQLFTSWSSYNTDFEQVEAAVSASPAGMFFTAPHDSFIRYDNRPQYFTFVKQIYNIENTRVPLARLIITTPMSVVEEIIRSYQTTDMFSLYLLDEDGQTMYALEGNGSGEPGRQSVSWEARAGLPLPEEENKTNFIKTSHIDILNWTLCYAAPRSVIFAEAISLRHTVIFVFLGCFLLIAALSLALVYRLLSPLRQLTAGMKRARLGDWDMPPLPVASQDEAGALTEGFNRLLAELRRVLEQVKESERQKNELRFEMLLAQINPHFLFNTLNSIKWMATMVHADKIVDTIRALARLLEISMNRQADFLPIEEELKNLKSYLAIQAVRYSDLFTVTYDIEDGLERYETLKLLFQPIVENAIIHNVAQQERIVIHICGVLRGDTVVFDIIDNGRGMTPQQVRRVLMEGETSEKSVFRGIGVRNVQQRIVEKYGPGYGIVIHSDPGKGTDVQITFPAAPARMSSEGAYPNEV